MIDCQLWEGCIAATGYGRLTVNYRQVYAHRYVWELHYGPIPEGMQLHHVCGERACICVDHLKLVTTLEHADEHAATHCQRGHLLTPQNRVRTGTSSSGRVKTACRRCVYAQARSRYQKARIPAA
jgi:hypothetical protein